ncbi:hypothetical protein HCR_20800 [Hydrogenimonas cancrithermarum]|uniref:Uncharacterized protein n=1 Tax=Hydrogenimonas cancrithermarum TaxID=2993563 RepID=A0ABN6WXJ2_9BACT|nr:hypothetical protein HCR_20800 [Hydrogenimonas cancrithermarum]
MQNDWVFAALYGTIATFFIWLLQNNIKAIMRKKGRCSPGRCSLLDLFKRPDKKPENEDLRHE